MVCGYACRVWGRDKGEEGGSLQPAGHLLGQNEGFLKTCFLAGVLEVGRKEEPRLGIHVFESPDSIVRKKEYMFVMFIKGKPNRKKEKASRAAF